MAGPWTFDQAVLACEEASREQTAAEEELGRANRAYAQANEAYRVALALKMWELRRDGVAWTVVGDLARGDAQVAKLKKALIEAEGDHAIAGHAIYKRGADRRDVERQVEWSMRRELAEGYGRGEREPERPIVFGGRREAA